MSVKSKQRVADHGEVFTSEREVNAMLNLVDQETQRIDSRFLEPACGDGNFLIEILRRKLAVIEARYKKSRLEYERYCVLGVGAIYGVELLEDNVLECRARLFKCFDNHYSGLFKTEASEEFRDTIRFIFARNILWGDALTLKTVDGKKAPIVFSEWSLVEGSNIKRRDYSMAHMLAYQPMDGPNLFSDLGEEAFIPKPVAEFPITHFLKLAEATNA